MMDTDVFAEEIFGFHAQQAVERSLKAWLALLGRQYPATHDISALLEILGRSGLDVEPHWNLVEYNVYAVRLRYESVDLSEEPLDRAATVRQVENLLGLVEKALAEVLGSP